MATIIVDGKTYDVTDGENLLHACLSAGLDLPYFCWHPAMGSVGACRQCAIVQYQDEDDTRGRLTMACMTPVSDGLRISVDADNACSAKLNNATGTMRLVAGIDAGSTLANTRRTEFTPRGIRANGNIFDVNIGHC